MTPKHMASYYILIILIISNVLPAIAQKEITVAELKDHIAFLASDSLKGRKAGTREDGIAAQYIEKDIEKDKLTLLTEHGFQMFDVVTSVEAGQNNRLSFAGFEGICGENFTPFAFSENDSSSTSVVFAGYGFDFDSDSLSWHDYDSVDVAGKWAMILRGDPEIEIVDSQFGQHSDLRQKVLKAKDHGAAGVLFVSGKVFDDKDRLAKISYERNQATVGIPVIHIKREVADSIMKHSNTTIVDLEQHLNQTYHPHSFEVDMMVKARTEVIRSTESTQNVIALLPGNDPTLKDEYVVLGAHYDHLGEGGPGSGSRRPDTLAIHNGADDNASGVAAILEIIEKLTANKKQLKRSVLFISFGAEELGTLGSKYFLSRKCRTPPARSYSGTYNQNRSG